MASPLAVGALFGGVLGLESVWWWLSSMWQPRQLVLSSWLPGKREAEGGSSRSLMRADGGGEGTYRLLAWAAFIKCLLGAMECSRC